MASYDDDDREIPILEYRLVRVDSGRQLMVRRMRACDAERFNCSWRERGIPTRWEAVQPAAAVA